MGFVDQPRVTIVTPSYNQARFLEETILSVLGQDYLNIEYIVIDGGSTDGSADIIKKHEAQIAYWVSEPDRGQSHGINKGWQRATGEIVAYLNSDDVYLPGAVTTAVRALQSDSGACMVYSDAFVIDGQGNPVKELYSQPFDVTRLILDDCYVPQPTVFMRRHALNMVGLLDDRLHMGMDYDLWIRLALRYPATYLRDTYLAKVREHPEAKSTAAIEAFPLERRRIMNKVFQRADLPVAVEKLRRHAFSSASFNQASLAARLDRPHHIMQPLLRAVLESPTYVAGRPHDAIYLAARALLPWWKGRSTTARS